MSISIVETPSTTLRYTESRAFIKAPASPGYTDSLLGKLGWAQYKHHDQRWYFREDQEQDWRWVYFNQIAFVPMINDKILITGPSVPEEYRWERYAAYSDQELRDRVVTVTGMSWSPDEDGSSGCVEVVGEVKSRQKPDDTEQVKAIIPTLGITMPWRFAEAVLTPDESECRARRFHEFHTLSANLYTANKDMINYQSDINLIGEMLENEATDRNWCDEYDTFIDHFNEQSKIAYIEPRSNDYDVEVELELTIRVKTTVFTSARNADEAVDNVRDMGMYDIEYDLSSLINSGDYDVTDEDIHEIGSANEV